LLADARWLLTRPVRSRDASEFILDEIDASNLRFLRSRPPQAAEPQRGPLIDERERGRTQRSGDQGLMGFVTTIAGRPLRPSREGPQLYHSALAPVKASTEPQWAVTWWR